MAKRMYNKMPASTYTSGGWYPIGHPRDRSRIYGHSSDQIALPQVGPSAPNLLRTLEVHLRLMTSESRPVAYCLKHGWLSLFGSDLGKNSWPSGEKWKDERRKSFCKHVPTSRLTGHVRVNSGRFPTPTSASYKDSGKHRAPYRS